MLHGLQLIQVFNFILLVNDWHTCPRRWCQSRASNPCSEYMFLDDTRHVTLASINLIKFMKFKWDHLKQMIYSQHTVRIVDYGIRNICNDGSVPIKRILLSCLMSTGHLGLRLCQYRWISNDKRYSL